MSAIILSNALAMSEFQGYSGDCTQTAELCCLHVLNPQKWPCDRATLDGIVARDIAQFHLGASGAETLADAATDLQQAGAVTRVIPYQEPLAFDWHSLLTATAGFAPILLQVANGAAFGQQSNLQYHAVAILGHDPAAQTYYVADGDNAACNGGKLVVYSLAQLIESRPCGLIVVSLPPPPPPPPPPPAVDLAAVKTALEAIAAELAHVLSLLSSVG